MNGRCKTTLLFESKESIEHLDEIIALGGFDEAHIGLNDLHLSYGMTFMFEPLSNGMVEQICAKFKEAGIPYGFGGVAKIGEGLLPAECVIAEHYRLGSTRAILSRSFAIISMWITINGGTSSSWVSIRLDYMKVSSQCYQKHILLKILKGKRGCKQSYKNYQCKEKCK